MILQLFRFIKGYLEIVLRGRKAGRFFNLCTRNDMKLWNVVQTEEDTYRFFIMLEDYRRIRPIRRKTHVRLKILKKHGLPFWVFKYRCRFVFPAAILVVSGALWCFSGYIWKINIQGNSYLSDDVLVKYLQSRDWGYGSKKNEIDCSEIELALRTDFSEIIWASSYMRGTMLVVEVQENIKTDQPEETVAAEDACISIASDKEAVIASIITRNGTPLVKAGDTVTAGDILVLGQETILDDNGEAAEYLYLPADADIMGYVTYEYTDTIPVQTVVREDTGVNTIRYFVEILGKNFIFPVGKPDYECYFCIREYDQVKLLDDFYLPVFWGEEKYFLQQEEPVEYDEKEAKALAEQHLEQFLKELEEDGVSIIEKNVIMKKDGDHYSITGTIYACEPIGCYQYGEQTGVQKEGALTDEYE